MSILKGILLKRANVPNINGHSFSEKAIESMYNQIREQRGKLYGTLGQNNENIDLTDITHMIEDASLKNDGVYIDIKPINDAILEHIDHLKPALRFSTTDDLSKPIDNFKIISIDLVPKDE